LHSDYNEGKNKSFLHRTLRTLLEILKAYGQQGLQDGGQYGWHGAGHGAGHGRGQYACGGHGCGHGLQGCGQHAGAHGSQQRSELQLTSARATTAKAAIEAMSFIKNSFIVGYCSKTSS
jgi:hypothetical protein